MWLIGAMVCLLAAPSVQLSVSAGNGWPHNALRHHWLIPISCHFRDCKALLVTSDSYKWRYSKCPDLYLYLYIDLDLSHFAYVPPGVPTRQAKMYHGEIFLCQSCTGNLPCTVVCICLSNAVHG